MALIIRIDVDRPYGKTPAARHLLSRLSSDFYCPRISSFGYLAELRTMLEWLNAAHAQAYVFFRRCTLPSGPIMELLNTGRHQIGLHLENSRNFDTFCDEIRIMERHFGQKMQAVSKHGSGGAKYGFHHYAPYEPEKYIEWARRASMKLFLGNMEDPTLEPQKPGDGLTVFPSAFWLEPHWRDTQKYPVDWLLQRARERDVVLLVHPENVIADSDLVANFQSLIRALDSRVIS